MPAAATATSGTREDVRALVSRAQGGDRGALEELYLLHFDRIYGYLYLAVGNRHDAEDLTTKTFLRMLESIGRFRFGKAPFSAWLFRIAHNLAIDHFRAARRLEPVEELPKREEVAVESAEEQALQELGRRSLLDLIATLSPEQQQVLTLKFVFDFS